MYPADPEDGYGQNYSANVCADTLWRLWYRNQLLDTTYIWTHGTYDGGREKAPAALCRKIIKAKK